MTRLPPPFGNRIDRTRALRFTFDGRPMEGFAGDTVASALLANGQHLLSRSFKYHRPRGLFSMTGADANALVQDGDEPNVDAGITRLAEGMMLSAQNVNGTLERDRDALIGRLARFLPVGFYYRTFMGPSRDSWLKLWEPLIRRKAGLGRVAISAAAAHGEAINLHCDILVVGGGSAGVSAAAEAAAAGADVILCEAEPEIGGAATYSRNGSDIESLSARLRSLSSLRTMTGTVCNGWFENNWMPLISGGILHRVRAKQVIVAAGTIEQPAVFHNNDLPGIMPSGTVRRLIRHYGVKPGERAVVLAGTAEGYDTALMLMEAGVAVTAVIEPVPRTDSRAEELRSKGVTFLKGRIDAARGGQRVSAVEAAGRWIECDLVAVSWADVPAWQIPCQAGAKLVCRGKDGYVFRNLPRNLLLAGSIRGCGSDEDAAADGIHVARNGLVALGIAAPAPGSPPAPAQLHQPFWDEPALADPRGFDFLDFDEDLQAKDIVNAVAEGYRDIELVKRFSTAGMGPSQGRHSALHVARTVAAATGRSVEETGFTTARPPVQPEALAVLAGGHAIPERRTALHAAHLALDAEMRLVGNWWRPYLYPSAAPRAATIVAEVKAVREAAGLLDVSTLGKLEVRGPDAGAFLDRIYATTHGNQPLGRVRYALMLNEMGSVIDDGVVLRLAEDRYYVTATTGAVARVYADMTFWNAQWRMKVDVANLTGALCGLNITGPLARAVLQAVPSDIDFTADRFPYLQGRSGMVAGVAVRAMRIGFTGELSYELHCPSSNALALWRAITEAGAAQGLRPYGLEASRILRLEKGHILIGQDTDAMSTPDELGMSWAVSKKKAFFVGQRSVTARRNAGLTRKLAGLVFTPEAGRSVGEGCLVIRGGKPAGHVTSIAQSPSLGHPVALAYVDPVDGAAGSAATVRARDGRDVTATVAGHAFFDPGNKRQEI